ncbi:oxalate:formate antiporter [Burkholderiaceae bacterium DAT-1]|nr:oxalate:formate antiporter [Burkholderiaceae bacterium DAT-1]
MMSRHLKGLVLWLLVLAPLTWGIKQTIIKTLALFG